MRYLSGLLALVFEVLFQLFDFLQVSGIGGLGLCNLPLLVENLITLTGDPFHVLAADRACTCKNGLIIECQHLVDVVTPEVQGQLFLLLDPQFRYERDR